MMSGLGVINDTCHQKTKTKGDTWEPCVTPLKKDQVVDKNGWWKGGKERKKERGKRKGERNEGAIDNTSLDHDKATIKTHQSKRQSLSTQ